MFQLDKRHVGCRFSENDLNMLNFVLEGLQEKTGVEPSSIREGIMLIAENTVLTRETTADENTENSNENTENMVLFTDNAKSELCEHAENNGVNTDEPIDIGALTVIAGSITPTPDPEIKEIEKEVEVERQLDDHEVLITLDDDQLKVANQVRDNRGKELQKQGHDPEPLSELFKTCFFSEGNLFSFAGGWFTGL